MNDQDFMASLVSKVQAGEIKVGPELQHYGVLGMKWGVRKDRNAERRAQRAADKTAKRREAAMRSPTALSRNLDLLTPSEIDQAMRRMRLEREVRNLSKDELSRGQQMAQVVLNYGKTAVAFYGLYNSKAGKEIRSWLKNR